MALNPHLLRKDFPLLEKEVNGYKIAYLDNAATSQKPVQVIEAIREFYTHSNANVHRGIHRLSEEATDLYEKARDRVASFIGAGSHEIVFTRNTTEAINLAAAQLARMLRPGDEVVTTVMEHHSNLLPWAMLCETRRIRLRICDITDEGLLDYEELLSLITHRTRIVCVTHASNVLGTVNDVKTIAETAHDKGALVLVDGAQSVPHMPVDVQRLGCDMLAFSGHKMLGPMGIGVLYVKEELLESWTPVLYGGGIVVEVKCVGDVCRPRWVKGPERFEAGTPNVAGAVGLAAAIDYLEAIGLEEVAKHERKLTRYTLERMSNELNRVVTYGPPLEHRVGIIPFNVKGLTPHEVAALLDQFGIAVRSGLHCAQPLHDRMGVPGGTVRASFYLYNIPEEADRLVEALKIVEEGLG